MLVAVVHMPSDAGFSLKSCGNGAREHESLPVRDDSV